jgi:hypothetical protein
MLSVVSPLHPCRGNYAKKGVRFLDPRDVTEGELVVAEEKLEGVTGQIKDRWLIEAWTHQQRINGLLRALIKRLEVGR